MEKGVMESAVEGMVGVAENLGGGEVTEENVEKTRGQSGLSKTITWKLNVFFTVLFFFMSFFGYLYKDGYNVKRNIDTIIPHQTWVHTTVLGLIIFLLCGAAMFSLREFWNRFLVDVFSVRPILFKEVYAIVLIALLFFGT